MGNEISHQRHCRRAGKSERQGAEQEKAEADLSTAQKSLLENSENSLPEEKSQDSALGMQNKEMGSETASSSLQHTQKSVPQTARAELQDLGETQLSVQEPEETETKPAAAMSPDMLTLAATAQPAAGDAGVTKTDLPLQAAGEVGAREAEDVVINQAAVGKCPVVCKRPSGKLCRPSPLCRWLKKLKSSTEKKEGQA